MTTRELHHDRLVENTKTPHPMESVSSLLNKRKESVLGKVANSANHEKPLNCNYLNGIPQPQTLLASQWEQPIPLTQLPPPSPYPVFKYFALERYTPDDLCDQEMIEHAHWIFELTRCIRLGFIAPDYASWRKVVFVIPNE